MVETFAVPVASARDGGSLSVGIVPSDVPDDYVGPDGIVNLEVDVANTADATAWESQATLGLRLVESAEGAVWADPAQTTEGGVAASATAVLAEDVMLDPVQLEVVWKGSGLVEKAAARDVGASSAAEMAPLDDCSWDVTRLAGTRGAWARVGTTFTGPGWSTVARHVFERHRTHETEFGVSVAKAGTGEWGASGTVVVGSGFGWIPPAGNGYRRYSVELNYGRYETERTNCLGNKTTYVKYKARYETGGTGLGQLDSKPTYTHCTTVALGEWYREESNGSKYNHGAGVEFSGVVGFDLGVEGQYGIAKRLSYFITGSKKMCGSNRDPSLASNVAVYDR